MAVTLPCYVTRQQLAASLDVNPAGGVAAELDRCINNGSRAVETLCRRVFYPTTATRVFDWPSPDRAGVPGYRLWLDESEIVSLVSITAGGVALDTSDVLLEPARLGPPYDHIDLNLGTSATYTTDDTWQQSISVAGVWAGAPDSRESVGTATEALDASETDVDVSTGVAAGVGVGDVLLVDSERMLVTSWGWATTGATATLTAVLTDQAITVADIAAYTDGELLLLGGERMRIRDRSGTTLTVDRAVDGTTLAAHSSATLYAARTLRVVRGSLGTTAATHLTAATVYRQVWPGLVTALSLAEAEVEWLQARGGRARQQGSAGSGRKAPSGTIEDLRAQCRAEHGRYRFEAV